MAALVERQLARSGRLALTGLLVAGTTLAIADPFTLTLFAAYAAVGALLIVRRPAKSLAATAHDAMRPTSAAVWLRAGSEARR